MRFAPLFMIIFSLPLHTLCSSILCALLWLFCGSRAVQKSHIAVECYQKVIYQVVPPIRHSYQLFKTNGDRRCHNQFSCRKEFLHRVVEVEHIWVTDRQNDCGWIRDNIRNDLKKFFPMKWEKKNVNKRKSFAWCLKFTGVIEISTCPLI